MKKSISLITAILMLVSISACNKNIENEEPSTNPTGMQSVYLVNGFEERADLSTMLLNGYLGRVQINEKQEYIKSGTGSAELTVISDPIIVTTPYLYQDLCLEKRELDLTDFSNVRSLETELYNPNDKEMRIGIQLVYNATTTGGTKWYSLTPNAWTTVKFNVAREYIPEYTQTDIDGNEKKTLNVDGVNLYFQRGEQDYTLYMDDMRVYTTQKAYSPVTLSLEENEIALFDKDWQVEFMQYNPPLLLKPKLEQSTVTKDGKGYSLKLEAPASTSVDATRYPGISLYQEQLALVPWEMYENSKNAKVCFDVYLPEQGSIPTVSMSFFHYSEETLKRTKIFDSNPIELRVGKWVTAEIPVETICRGTYAQGLTFKDVNILTITWQEFSGSDTVFYLDNIRIEYD